MTQGPVLIIGAGWTGFVRPNDYLLLVIVAGEDDPSGPPDLGALAASVLPFLPTASESPSSRSATATWKSTRSIPMAPTPDA